LRGRRAFCRVSVQVGSRHAQLLAAAIPFCPGFGDALTRDLRIGVAVVAVTADDEAAGDLRGQRRIRAAKWACEGERSGWPKANEMVLWTISRSIATAYGRRRELGRAAGGISGRCGRRIVAPGRLFSALDDDLQHVHCRERYKNACGMSTRGLAPAMTKNGPSLFEQQGFQIAVFRDVVLRPASQ
jgi:hypothetical protein